MVKICDTRKNCSGIFTAFRPVVTCGKEPRTRGSADLLSVVATSKQKETASPVATDEQNG